MIMPDDVLPLALECDGCSVLCPDDLCLSGLDYGVIESLIELNEGEFRRRDSIDYGIHSMDLLEWLAHWVDADISRVGNGPGRAEKLKVIIEKTMGVIL